MSWVALAPRAKTSASPVVTISVSKAGGPLVQRAYVTVRPTLLPGGLDWWRNRAAVQVDMGVAENAGRVRIARDGPYKIMGAVGRDVKGGKVAAPTLQIALDGLPAAGLARTKVLWELVGDALIVTLPWSAAKGMSTSKPAASASPPRVDAPVTPDAPPPIAAVQPSPVQAPVAVPKPALSQPPVRQEPARPPLEMSYREIEQWAILHNCGTATHGFDLARVNQKRIARDERPFIIRKTVKGKTAASPARTVP